MSDMNRRRFLRAIGAGAAATAVSSVPAARGAASGRKPNFVFILIDDLGWADVACYGSTLFETPNIDRLARQGMRFTDAYAACPVCSPTRASIVSGKYPAHVNLTDFIPGHWRPWAKLVVPEFNQSLPLEEVTIAEALKSAGYVSGIFGKWHLGRHSPKEHGFDEFRFGGENKNDKRVGAVTGQTLDFIEKHKDRPFFAFASHHTVHIPLEADEKLVAKYEAKIKPSHTQKNAKYAAMVEAMDASVGQVMQKLDDLGIADNTVLIFTSDNGGLIQIYNKNGPIVTSNLPLRAEKGTLYEGGIRVPLIVRWPGAVKPGSECGEPVSSVDFYPTLLDMAGASRDPSHALDGRSLVPLLRERGGFERDAIYWHYPHYHHCPPCGSIREGDYKLIEYFEEGDLELYNLKEDIGEKNNLAETMPEKATALRKKLAAWRKSVNAKMPTRNPQYNPEKAHEWGRRKKK